MVGGTNGKYGGWGNEESATCRFEKRIKVPNPCLSANVQSIVYERGLAPRANPPAAPPSDPHASLAAPGPALTPPLRPPAPSPRPPIWPAPRASRHKIGRASRRERG